MEFYLTVHGASEGGPPEFGCTSKSAVSKCNTTTIELGPRKGAISSKGAVEEDCVVIESCTVEGGGPSEINAVE